MNTHSDYVLQRKSRADLNPSVRMYGESEPPEMQLDNMWEVVPRSIGAKLQMVKPDFSEFTPSDRMYPSMMRPDVKERWDMKNREWENQKDKYERIERMARAEFLVENPDLPLARALAKTSYGKELLVEGRQAGFIQPKAEAGTDLHGKSGGVYGGGSNAGNNAVKLSLWDNILDALFTEKNVLETFYIWQANEGACKACTNKNGETSKTPTMVRPHPNCKCRQVKCEIWEGVTRWKFVKEIKTLSYEATAVVIVATAGKVSWRRKYIAEEQREKKRVKECDDSEKLLFREIESRRVIKTDVVKTDVCNVHTGRNIQTGDMAFTYHPGTGETIWFPTD